MRIVSLIPSATEAIAALGLADALVGITHSCDHPPGLEARRVTSTSIPEGASSSEIDRIVKESARHGHPLYELDAGLIESLRPDLVVTQAVCDVCAVGEGQALAGLRSLSVQPAVLSLHPHRFEDVLDDIHRLGAAANVRSRSDAVVDALRARVERVRERVHGREPVVVVVLEWIDPLFGAGHWTPEIVAMAGGREALAAPGERSRELSWDEILGADPDVLLLACCGHDVERTMEDLRSLESRPGFGRMRAVRTGRVFVADGGAHFSRPGPRLVDSLELLADTLHPETVGAEALRRAYA